MEFKDYYAVMGVDISVTPEDIKRAHRKLARKYHPDVSKEKDAEVRFKELAEAYDVLKDPVKRAAYDRLVANYKAGQDFQPPPDWASQHAGQGGYSQSFESDDRQDHSAFFNALFRGTGRGQNGSQQRSHEAFDIHGQDQHAKIQIDIEDSYKGATRTLQLRMQVEGSDGRPRMDERTIEFVIPKGIRAGQHIRLAAQGGPGMAHGNEMGSPGDLYLDVEMLPHALYRTDGYDVLMDLPIAPWEAAMGAEVIAPTPTGQVEIKIPAGSTSGRKLRVKGRGLPGKIPGDFYYVLKITQPKVNSDADKKAYANMQASFNTFNPRAHIEELSA